MIKTDPKIRTFRNRYEQELRRIITLSVGITACVNEGNVDVEDAEMTELARSVMELVNSAKRAQKKESSTQDPATLDRKIRSIR